MSEKEFALAVVLSVFYPRQMPAVSNEEVYRLLRFLTGNYCLGENGVEMEERIRGAFNQCRPMLCRQFPLFDTSEAWDVFYRLLRMVERLHDDEINDCLIGDWLRRQAEKYGETLYVKNQ